MVRSFGWVCALLLGCACVATSPGQDAGPSETDGGRPGGADAGRDSIDAGQDPGQGPTMRPPGIDPERPETIPGDPAPTIDTDEERLLRKAVRFYGAQRCGDGANWLLMNQPTGDRCHMQDGHAVGEDMTGGWHDAGDFIKFSLTNAWSSYVLLKTFEVYPDAFDDQYGARHQDAPNGIPDLLDQVAYAADYLVKIHPEPNRLVARVAGDQDHGPFVTSPTQSTWDVASGGGARPVDPNGAAGADVAGLAAASLALMARFYAAHDSGRATTYLLHARQIYAYGEANLRTTSDNFYQDGSYPDNMMCGAIELYHATGEASFLEKAETWNTMAGRHYWVVDWANSADYCRHSMVQAGASTALTYWRQDVDSYLPKVSDQPNTVGLAYFAQWGSLRYATGAAYSAALLFDVTGEQRYLDFARSQLAYVKGNNEYNRSFVVGYGSNPPRAPHHRNSYGRDFLDDSLPHLFELTGALVGGPTTEGYTDTIHDYVVNEVTIDYNTGLVGLAAAEVAAQRR